MVGAHGRPRRAARSAGSQAVTPAAGRQEERQALQPRSSPRKRPPPGNRQDDADTRRSRESSAGTSGGQRRGAQPRGRNQTIRLYTDLDYEQALKTLEPLRRRFRVRMGRRLRMARRGRIDIRRTIRAGIQRGGALIDLRMRRRRPRHVDLLLLADISGSVRYASSLMLGLAAGARECFRTVHSFVYVDHLAEAGFEQGYLNMMPMLDLYARSDFGRVLAELLGTRRHLLNRQTLVVILGDGRNNRKPARADLLARSAGYAAPWCGLTRRNRRAGAPATARSPTTPAKWTS